MSVKDETIGTGPSDVDPSAESVLMIGKAVYIRTVTYAFIGKVTELRDTHDGRYSWVTLFPAVWVADSARHGAFLREGGTSGTEWEPYIDPVVIPFGVVVDVTRWRHEVPTAER